MLELFMNNLGEVWKKIKEFPDYEISNLGRIKSFKNRKEKILEPYYSRKHLQVSLYKNKKRSRKYIHHLVYETFKDYKLKEDECVHHVDQDPENNYVDNLKLMTKSKHHSLHNKGKNHPMYGKHFSDDRKRKISEKNKGRKHTKESKRKMCGENSGMSILNKKNVVQIKIDLEEGKLTQKEIAKKFMISSGAISNIKTGRTWKHIK